MSKMRFLKLAVIGDPVAHSKSPELHARFLAEAGIAGSYEAICVPIERVAAELARLALAGYKGLNVTTPLKEAVLAHVCASTALVDTVGAANTLTYSVEKRGWTAANTDAAGARNAVEVMIGTPLAGKRILVLGMGPTSRAAVSAFMAADAETLIWNRSVERAAAVAERCGAQVWQAQDAPVDVVFSGLPPDPVLPQSLQAELRNTPFVLDANYGIRSTLASLLGRGVVTGEFMLAAQARESFDLWCDVFGGEATSEKRKRRSA